jgi:hypothetical protein
MEIVTKKIEKLNISARNADNLLRIVTKKETEARSFKKRNISNFDIIKNSKYRSSQNSLSEDYIFQV